MFRPEYNESSRASEGHRLALMVVDSFGPTVLLFRYQLSIGGILPLLGRRELRILENHTIWYVYCIKTNVSQHIALRSTFPRFAWLGWGQIGGDDVAATELQAHSLHGIVHVRSWAL